MVDDHNQRHALGITIAFPILGGIALGLRLWSRKISRSPFGWDDYLIVLAYILIIGQTITTWNYIKVNYVGIHIWDVPTDLDTSLGIKWNLANQLIYNPVLSVVKASVLIFLSRLDSRTKAIKGLIWATFWFNLGLAISIFFADLFQCYPISSLWDTSIEGRCIDSSIFFVITASMVIVTDLLVLAIPILVTYGLQMRKRQKIAIIAILSLGGIATAIGIWRLVILIQLFYGKPSADPTYAISFCVSSIEVNVAVISACGPSMKSLTKRYLPRLLGSSKRGTSGPTGYGSTARRGTGQLSQNKSLVRPEPGDVLAFEMEPRNYGRMAEAYGGKSTTLGSSDVSLSESDEQVISGGGIMKTTNVSVQYNTNEGHQTSPMETRTHRSSRDGKTASVDSLV